MNAIGLLLWCLGTASGGEVLSTNVPAVGEQEVLFRIDSFGRYAVRAESTQGTALRLVDRMTGPGPTQGRAGGANGRVDAFLDRGEYKIEAFSHPDGEGVATVAVLGFEDTSSEASRLIPFKWVHQELEDLQQRSWWIEVTQRQTLSVEAAGRHLSDLRLWRDGNWLVANKPENTTVEPRAGQPLRSLQLAAAVQPGWYRLTAYGGPALAWAQEGAAGAAPLHVRYGLPELAEIGRTRYEIGPLGVDRFVVPAPADTFTLELPQLPSEAGDAAEVALTVRELDAARPYRLDGRKSRITKESADPVMTVSVSRGTRKSVIVQGVAGQPYVLQHFKKASGYIPLKVDGAHWLSTVHAGHAGDSLDVTGLLTKESGTKDKRERTILPSSSVISIGSKQAYRRRFNLLQSVTLFIEIEEASFYRFSTSETQARIRVEPVLTRVPKGYRRPDLVPESVAQELEPGFYAVEVEPVARGIVTLDIRKSTTADKFKEWVGVQQPEEAAFQAGIVFPVLPLNVERNYALIVNAVPGTFGVALRSLPIDPSDALPMSHDARQTLSVPVKITERGRLTAIADDGTALELSINRAAWKKSITLGAGTFSLRVRNPSQEPLRSALHLVPERLQSTTSLPLVTASMLSAIPDFPVLDASAARFLDLNRNEKQTLQVTVRQPGLYRLETTGLLRTRGDLRTRTVPHLTTADANGVGRNMLVQQYLREGDYQITVQASGMSKGHLGVQLARTELREGGELTPGVPARASLKAGEGIVYRFQVSQGRYHLSAFGLAGSMKCRLEDAEGWPLVKPGSEADLVRELKEGEYRLVLLPGALPSQSISLIERLEEREPAVGKGPHPLPWNERVEHLWMQDEESDHWTFSVPSAATVSLQLEGEMKGSLEKVTGTTATEVGRIHPRRGFSGELEPGQYRLLLRGVRRSNELPYAMVLSSKELLVGQQKSLTAPAALQVSVGSRGWIDLSSFGRSDVRARLELDGTIVATNDDRPEDWNFQLQQRVNPGLYTLFVEPVGQSRAATMVRFNAPQEQLQAPLKPGRSVSVRTKKDALLFPLEVGDATVIALSIDSLEMIGASLETLLDDRWEVLDTTTGRQGILGVWLDGSPVRLRVWSLDQRGNPATIEMGAFARGGLSERRLQQGLRLKAITGGENAVGLASVKLEHPGLFKVSEGWSGLRWCAAPGAACRPVENQLIPAVESHLTLMGRARAMVRAKRQRLDHDSTVTAVLTKDATLLAADLATQYDGPVVAMASSTARQPGIDLVERGAVGRREQNTAGLAVARNRALAVSLSARGPMARVWAGDGVGEDMELRLSARSFPSPRSEPMDSGRIEGQVDSARARRFGLPRGDQKLRLSLGAGMVGVVSSGAKVEQVLWAAEKNEMFEVRTSAERLTLLNLKDEATPFVIQALSVSVSDTIAISLQKPFEERLARHGTLVVPAKLGVAPVTVRSAGGVSALTWIGRDGRVQHGTELKGISGQGQVIIRHQPGEVLVWAQTPQSKGLWGDFEPVKQLQVDGPMQIRLKSMGVRLKVKSKQPSMVHLRSTVPLVARIEGQDRDPQVIVSSNSMLDVWLPGHGEVALRVFGGGRFSGPLEITISDPQPIAEGLSDPVMVAPGETRVFSFEVTRAGEVGVGVRADADIVESVVLDERGRVLGSGVVQMLTLEPGRYLLALSVPKRARPVQLQPALVGVDAPSSGPPDEEIKKYLQFANEEAQP